MSKYNIVTRIKLDKPYINIGKRTDYKITAPDGYSFIHTLCLSNGLKEYIEHTKGLIEPVTHDREKRNISISGVRLIQVESDVIEMTTKNRETAIAYYRKVKPVLVERGYRTKHSCKEEPKPTRRRIKCPSFEEFVEEKDKD